MGQDQSRIVIPNSIDSDEEEAGHEDSLLAAVGGDKDGERGEKKKNAAKDGAKKILSQLERVEGKITRSGDAPNERRIHELLAASFVDRFTVSESNAITRVVTDTTKGDTSILPAHMKTILYRLEKVLGYRHVYRTPCHADLFNLFDIDKKGVLDLHQLLTGLGIICKGTAGERLRLSFDLSDVKGKGFLDRSDIFRCLKSAFLEALSLMNLPADVAAARQRTLIHTSRNWTDKIITAANAKGKFRIDFEEYKAWAVRAPIINLDPNKNPLHNFYLTFLYVDAPRSSSLPQFRSDAPIYVKIVRASVTPTVTPRKYFCQIYIADLSRAMSTSSPQVQRTNSEETFEPQWDAEFRFDLAGVNVKEAMGLRADVMQEGLGGAKVVGSVLLDWLHIRNSFGGRDVTYPVFASRKGRSNSRKVTLTLSLSPHEFSPSPSSSASSDHTLPPISLSSFSSLSSSSHFDRDPGHSESSGLLDLDSLSLSSDSPSSLSSLSSSSSSSSSPAPTPVELFSTDSLCFTTDMTLAPFDYLLPALTIIPEDFLFFHSLLPLDPLLAALPKHTLRAFLNENHDVSGVMEFAFQSFNLEEGAETSEGARSLVNLLRDMDQIMCDAVLSRDLALSAYSYIFRYMNNIVLNRLMCAPATASLALFIKNCMASLSEGFHDFFLAKEILLSFQMSFESLSQAANIMMVDKSVLLRDESLHFPGLTACQLYQLLEMCRPDSISPAPVPNSLKSKVLQLAFEEKKNKFANDLFF